MRFLNQQAFRRAACLMVALLLLFQSAGAVAPGPGWWTQQEVLDPQAQPDDFAAANLGQLKFMTVRASSALDQWEAASARPLSTAQQGAKAAIHAMIATWNTAPAPNVQRDDFRALNAGQLKQVAALFYDRLGLPHPWPAVSADDHPMVNVGQLKQMFSFELRVMRGSPAMPIPSAVLQPADAAWQVLAAAQAAPAGSTPEDFDGDGISNWQEYQMHPELPLFDSADKDGDRILDSVETANAPILNPLIFADAVADHDGDGVMNYEEVLLGLNLANLSSGRADGLNDAEVLAWGLLAGVPLAPSTNAVRACWEAIDEAWIEQQGGMAFYGHWLNRTLVNNQPAGWTAFQAEFWGPTNPDAAFIQNPPAPIDLDGDDIPDMDRDGDGLPDLWEYRYQLDPRNEDDDSEDPDGDTLINLVEFASGTNPRLADTDGDGFTDAEELAHQSDPRQGSSMPPVVLQLTGKAAHQHYPGETTSPLAVRATQAGIARMGIEVTFTRLTGGGMLSPANQAGASAASSLTVTTGADGLAAITYTAAGEPEKAIIRATAPGVTANIAFTIRVIAVPDDFAGAGSGGGQVGGSGGGEVGGIHSILPTAIRLLEALFAGSDGMFLRYALKLDKEKQFPPDNELGWLYLGAGQPLDGVSSGGYGTSDIPEPTKGVSHQRRIVFESAIRPCSRTYLVLFFQDERVNPGLNNLLDPDKPKLAITTGTLTFSAQDQKTRTITIAGSIPPKYMKEAADANGNPAVDFLEPPPAKEGDRFWMALVPVALKQAPLDKDQIHIKPLPIPGPNGPPLAEPSATLRARFSRWREAFDGAGNFREDWIKSDPDRATVVIGSDAIIDAGTRFINVITKNIQGVPGHPSDRAPLRLHPQAGALESDPFVFVADRIDDATYNGMAGDQNDDGDFDQTRLAGFGAEIWVKLQLKGQSNPIEFQIGQMYQPKKTVPVELNILKQGVAITNEARGLARNAFEVARLLYRQIGYNLVLVSNDPKEVDMNPGFVKFIERQSQPYIDYSTPEDAWDDSVAADKKKGQTFNNYIKGLGAGANALKVFFTLTDLRDDGAKMGHSVNPNGWGYNGQDCCIVELQQETMLKVGYTLAHEMGHVLGAPHPSPSTARLIMNGELTQWDGNYKDPRRFSPNEELFFPTSRFAK